MKFVVVGKGRIGNSLTACLKESGGEVVVTGRDSGPEEMRHICLRGGVQAVFVTISTKDRGEAARDFIIAALDAGVPYVITCEKGSWAYHPNHLWPYKDQIGSWAVVGGGSQLIPFIASHRLNDFEVRMDVVLNGTLNFLLTHQEGLEVACREAITHGYVEPGAFSPLSVVNGEYAFDVPRKVAALYNILLARRAFLSPDVFGKLSLSEDAFARLKRDPSDYRVIVSFCNEGLRYDPYPVRLANPLIASIDGWKIAGGFVPIDEVGSRELAWVPRGVGNAVNIARNYDAYQLSGPGAGVGVTVSTLINNYRHLANIS